MKAKRVFFQNEIGSISYDTVVINGAKQNFNFKNIAYIEIKKRRTFLGAIKFFLRIIFTNATLQDCAIKKKQVKEAKTFENEFLFARAYNPSFE